MKPETRQRIKVVMEAWVASQASTRNRFDATTIRQSYPFHQLIFSIDEIMLARTERSIVTSMGDSLYPHIALELAKDRYQDVFIEYPIVGEVSDGASNMIEQIVTELREPSRGRRDRRRPNQESELSAILDLREGSPVQHAVIADLYISDFDGGPLFVELKTPLPNLDIAAESKRKMLYFLAIMERRNVTGAKAFLGLTYNPHITRARGYSHSYTRRIMDMENEVLIGSEFWDYIGGPGAYDELLEIVSEINSS